MEGMVQTMLVQWVRAKENSSCNFYIVDCRGDDQH